MGKNYIKKSTTILGLTAVFILTTGFFIRKTFFKTKDSVDVTELEIKLPAGKKSIKIGATQTALINALGQPKQISPYSSQAHYKQGTVLNYNGAKFYFIHNKLTNFEITSHKYKIGLTSTHRYNSIGNSRSDLPKFNIQNKTALLDVTSDDSTTDQFLEYDLNDSGKLSKITYSDY